MTNPLVSIIVPVYNAQKGLSRCLESICSQTYQKLEIIVLNDGSMDDSLAICEQFRAKDPRIVVVDKENEGVSRTRNAGLTLAQGDYIQFVDSDDALDPDYTQNLVQAALEHNADLVIAPYWMVIPSNSSKTGHALETLQTSLGIEPEAPKTEVHKYGFLPQGVYSREDYARRLMQQPASFYYGVLWNKLYRREIIAQNQLAFAPDVHWAEDLIFNMGYLEHAEVFVSIPEAGYHYIQNPKSLCHTQIDLRGIVENKTQIFQLFKEVYTRLGLYEELQPQIYKFLFAFSESGVPSDSLQGALLDAVSRLIYWQGDPARGINGDTLDFLKNMNRGLKARHPSALLIAEDSTAYPGVTRPVDEGGLGFDYKWDLGWMHDTLEFCRTQPDLRPRDRGKLLWSCLLYTSPSPRD